LKAVVFFLALLSVSAFGQGRSAGYFLLKARIALDENKITLAEKYADSALYSARQASNLDSLMAAHLALYEIHIQKKDFEKAVGDFRMVTVYRDSIGVQKTKSELNEWKTSLDSEKVVHAKEVAGLREEISKLQEAARKDWQNTLLIIGGMLGLLALGVYIQYREKVGLQVLLKQSQHDVEELRAFKEKLFTILSFDLRSSLTSFENLTYGVSDQVSALDREDRVQFLNKLFITAGDLKSTLNNVTQWVSLQTRLEPYHPELFDCKVIADRVIEKNRAKLGEGKITGDVFMPDGQLVYADKGMIEVILDNLLSNAIHFNHPGGSATIFSGRKDGLVTIGVKDTGVGISKEDIDKLFRTEVDVHVLGKASHKGVGIGLILSKELVERNGGRMYVESTTGQGSTFYFTLPEKKFS
jgi:signal transduction histidine kinase